MNKTLWQQLTIKLLFLDILEEIKLMKWNILNI